MAPSIFIIETLEVSHGDCSTVQELIDLTDKCPLLPSVELSDTMTMGWSLNSYERVNRCYVKFSMPVSAEKEEGIVEKWERGTEGDYWSFWTGLDYKATDRLFHIVTTFRERLESSITVHDYGDDFDFGYES